MNACRNVVITLDLSHTFLVKVIPGNNQLSINFFFREKVRKIATSQVPHSQDTPITKTCAYVCAQSLQLCLTLCDPMDCSQPDSSVHGIFQARVLEWVAMPSYRSSRPKDQTCVSCVSCIAGRFFTHWTTWEAPYEAIFTCKGLPYLFSGKTSSTHV